MNVPLSPKLLVGLLAGFALAGLAAAWWFQTLYPYESTDNTYLKAHMSPISPKLSGYVRDILFKDNQSVQVGAPLIVLDDADFKARLAQAEAQVRLESAHIHTLETGIGVQQARIAQEQASLAANAAERERLGRELNRYARLVQDGSVSVQLREATEAALKQAQSQQERLRATRLEAEWQRATLEAQRVESQARLNMAEAQQELASIDLANTRITAPLAGLMGNRGVQVGQLVQPGRVLAQLIPAEGLFVEANFKETQMEAMRPGQAVEIRVDAFPDRRFEGTVDSFAPAAGSEFSLLPPENATGNFTKVVRRVPVLIVFKPGSDIRLLRPGLSSRVKVRVR
ncbi:MAG: HlyD family secretion protein [Methylococcaceae bacterium]